MNKQNLEDLIGCLIFEIDHRGPQIERAGVCLAVESVGKHIFFSVYWGPCRQPWVTWGCENFCFPGVTIDLAFLFDGVRYSLDEVFESVCINF